ncbi:IclR family transcriptional regulator [Microbacterium sp. CFBP9034]|uniref:IclR family transcriptional regulator n=1 Tax=Microbacterium sp. CFBP9034 TaxID=3096540 RepID=UPI002A6A13C1|nr:IclR family transcriptional regulator [Microbacterium sp. CFBP9034]MDY0908559.1 IclR family transcriptional regulator [Microbacterium sp. CFBP9034]
MRTADWTDSVSVLDRVTAVFDAFGEQDEGLGISELARRANLPKSTVSRIAADLVSQQFLDREGDKLYLGVRLFELGQTVEQPRRLRHAALPVMNELRGLTGQTVNLAILDGSDVVIIATVRGEGASKPPARVGGRLPAHATALGKALLAFSPKETSQRLAEAGLAPRTPRTICEPSALWKELVDIRLSGIAFEREECATGRVCVATPILAHGALPVAALSVTGSVEGLIPEQAGPAVRAAGITVGRRLGQGRPA